MTIRLEEDDGKVGLSSDGKAGLSTYTIVQSNIFFIPHERLAFEMKFFVWFFVVCRVTLFWSFPIPHILVIPTRSLYNPISVVACDNMYQYKQLQAGWFFHLPSSVSLFHFPLPFPSSVSFYNAFDLPSRTL